MSKNKKRNKPQPKKQKQHKSQAGEQRYEITLSFAGPFISQASGVMALGLDATMQRDSDQAPVINGSLIRGNIRHALSEFQKFTEEQQLKNYILSWFGEESKEGCYDPQRANLDFDFYWRLKSETTVNNKAQRTRIAIDKETNTVEEGALQVIEDCFPAGGKNPVFIGNVTLRYKLGNEPKNFKKWIEKALDYIPAMGSFKGSGFGRLLKCEVIAKNKTPENKPQEQLSLAPETTRFGIQLTLDQPFCLGRPKTPSSNFIVSEEIITGNVIKALIARSYHEKDQTKLSKRLSTELCFDDLIITHALPALKEKPERQAVLPLSLTIQKEKEKTTLFDMATLSKEALESYTLKEALSFAIDWKPKDFDFANQEYDKQAQKRTTINIERIIALRTGINPEKGISEEAQLFSLECIEPSKHVWCADIELANISTEKRQQVFQKLQAILKKDLKGIGKTKAQASIQIQALAFNNVPKTELSKGTYIVTLVSPARMLPPNMQLSGTNTNQQLRDYYQAYWQQISADIKLETYFAQQQLSSTYYHIQRDTNQQGQQYYPEWLSKEGSVFTLKLEDEKALLAIQHCLVTGLPAHHEVNNEQASWKTTPYLPEHGYGEIKLKKQGEANV